MAECVSDGDEQTTFEVGTSVLIAGGRPVWLPSTASCSSSGSRFSVLQASDRELGEVSDSEGTVSAKVALGLTPVVSMLQEDGCRWERWRLLVVRLCTAYI